MVYENASGKTTSMIKLTLVMVMLASLPTRFAVNNAISHHKEDVRRTNLYNEMIEVRKIYILKFILNIPSIHEFYLRTRALKIMYGVTNFLYIKLVSAMHH